MIKVGAVSYLNTKPLVYGFENGMMADQVRLIQDYPANIATMLLDNQIDIGLVPVAIIPRLSTYRLVGDYCIGADGEVASVCLFSEVPLQEVEELLLDYQSRTSVQLARILLKEYWKLKPRLIDAKEDFRLHIKGKTAGLVIGDRAFQQRKISPYVYDLGKAWKEMTGQPFVFAAWISNRELDEDFIKGFDEATGAGLKVLDKIVEQNPFPLFDLKQYFTKHISYRFDQQKKAGLSLFLEKLGQLNEPVFQQ